MDPLRERSRDVLDADATTAMHRVTVAPRVAPSHPRPALPAPRELSRALLPGEVVTLGSTPHPIVLLRPLALAVLTLIAFAVGWQSVAPPVHPFVEAGAAVALVATLATFARNLGYYLGFRAIATNRRIFVVRGILRRRVAPLGNTALASSTLVQGVLGRIYGFGSVEVPHAGARRPLFHDMRDPGGLYRECQAVANGVDGDHWTPAVRQTIIP